MQPWLYIGGQFVDGLAGGTIEVINPEAMHEYTQHKSVWVNVGSEVPDWYGS